LGPTAALVEIVSGIFSIGCGFVFESNTGYINHELRIIVAPACAGVNFLIAAFCMGLFSGLFKIPGFYSKLSWLAGCAAAAFLVTICVNAIRILISIDMITSDFHAGWFTPERVHRMAGILIYFFFLMIFYHIIQKIIHALQDRHADLKNRTTGRHHPENRTARAAAIGLFPLACYWMMAIVVPWLNHAYEKNPGGFMEHCAMVGIGSIFIFLILCTLKPLLNTLKIRFY
jgi:exosortase K